MSLLQYVDDAIIMREWDPCNAQNMVRVLKCFELCSGLKINLSKSKLVGVLVGIGESRNMARWLNCKEVSFPFSYLGLPVAGNMSKTSSWQLVIEKFNSRLSSWKANNLSIWGRLCLCKAVLGILSTYYFSLFRAPKRVLNILESLQRRFFWGGTEKSNCSN